MIPLIGYVPWARRVGSGAGSAGEGSSLVDSCDDQLADPGNTLSGIGRLTLETIVLSPMTIPLLGGRSAGGSFRVRGGP